MRLFYLFISQCTHVFLSLSLSYEEALKDLGTGQRIDFDEGSADLIKFLEQRVAKRRESNRKREERKKAEEAAAKAKGPDASIYDDMPEMEDIPEASMQCIGYTLDDEDLLTLSFRCRRWLWWRRRCIPRSVPRARVADICCERSLCARTHTQLTPKKIQAWVECLAWAACLRVWTSSSQVRA